MDTKCGDSTKLRKMSVQYLPMTKSMLFSFHKYFIPTIIIAILRLSKKTLFVNNFHHFYAKYGT